MQQEQKKIRKRQLDISAYYIGNIRPYSSQHMAESIKKLEHLSAKDKARMMLEAGKNKFESYIYLLKNKLIDDEERIREVTNEEQRESLRKMAEEANEWLDFDGWDADIETFERRYDELSAPAEEVFFRVVEATARPEAVEAVRQKLSKIEELVEKWATTMPHITEEERSDVSERVAKVRKQLEENEAEQATLKPWEAPVFRSAEIRPLLKPVESLVGRLGK